mmetsp:Transcript_56370/g.157059  ORF Transcript_56370/g.157059 Transcript_56370/m.157059 type:complete len:340 (+) Transcript_56370:4208-5227(+)
MSGRCSRQPIATPPRTQTRNTMIAPEPSEGGLPVLKWPAARWRGTHRKHESAPLSSPRSLPIMAMPARSDLGTNMGANVGSLQPHGPTVQPVGSVVHVVTDGIQLKQRVPLRVWSSCLDHPGSSQRQSSIVQRSLSVVHTVSMTSRQTSTPSRPCVQRVSAESPIPATASLGGSANFLNCMTGFSLSQGLKPQYSPNGCQAKQAWVRRLSTSLAPLKRKTRQSAAFVDRVTRGSVSAMGLDNGATVGATSVAVLVGPPADVTASAASSSADAVAARQARSEGPPTRSVQLMDGRTHCQQGLASVPRFIRGRTGSSHSQGPARHTESPSAASGQNSATHW